MIDLKEVVEFFNDVMHSLELLRANAEEEFHKLFLQAEISVIFNNLILIIN
jgi:hypothetical protein